MESVCPIDENCASEVSALLRPPSPAQLQEYLDELISKRNCHGIKIKQNSQLGKGVYADLDIQEEELILKDQMLAGIQHSSNKMDCLVCSFCFRFIGSVELQIGRKLYLQRLGDSANDKCTGTFSHNLDDCYESDSSDVEDDSHAHMHEDFGNCVSSSSKDNKISLPEGVIESLMNGELALPFSNRFPLPSTIPCHGGCGEAYYCSKACAEADWESFHSLLCIGERSEAPSRAALMKFIEHANGTNDIFLLAAKAICSVILTYRKLKGAHIKERKKITSCCTNFEISNLCLLLEAWKPISVGYKRRWWDCIALPDDVDPSDESSFRMQIRELALTSLQLLKAAIFDKECEPLFSLEIYGQIIGMFELNNLDLVVASPVEDYFLYIDDLPHSVKRDAEKITRPILDALGDDYSICCQGTAFFPLQSCMNHSCCPNAKAFKREEDRDGQATIIAQRPISKGEEVTISYIDEDLPYEERQSLLADYGFKCRCPKCLEDEVILDNRLYRSRSLCFEKDERTGIQ